MKDKVMDALQRFSKAMFIPVLILPIAGILIAVGNLFTNVRLQAVLPFLNNPVTIGFGTLLSGSLNAILGNLGVIFCVGLSVGLANKKKSEAGFISLLAFLVFLVAGNAEANRGPFDLAEAESELTAGYHTEYSGLHFGLFYLAEYLNLFIVSGVATLLFFGGWMPLHIPGWEGFNAVMDYIPSVVWFVAKAVALSFVIIWFKWTFPRLRIDQLLAFEWKYLLPINLFNLVLMLIVVLSL